MSLRLNRAVLISRCALLLVLAELERLRREHIRLLLGTCGVLVDFHINIHQKLRGI